MSRTLLVGRILTLLALAGLGISMVFDAPRLVWIGFAVLACIGPLAILVAPPPAGATGLSDLLSAAGALDAIARPMAGHLNTDTSQRALAAAAAQRIREVATLIQHERLAAAQREVTLRSLLDAVDEPILATDTEGRILICNAAMLMLLGLRADRLLNRPIEEAFTLPDLLTIIQAARNGTPTRQEVRIPLPDGPHIWATAAIPFGPPTGGAHAVALTLRDVTQQSLALQVKTDFVANASHELRTPVSAIRMAVETLEGLSESEQDMRARLFTMITSHTIRLEELIRDLLDLTRLESTDNFAHVEPVPASSLAATLAPMFDGVCRDRRLTLRFDFAAELEHLHSDHNLLLLILSNLIDNACKFAFEGTEILVSGRIADDPTSVRFEVIDRGVGIPINQQQRIFERFFQVDEARSGGKKRGTGLGLSIVKHAVRRLDGSIKVHSIWQHGTTMTVELPRCLGPITSESARPQPQPAP